MEAIFRTHVGKIRRHNEDDGAFEKNESGQTIVLVADGMGGHQAGDVASQMTKELLLQRWNAIEHSMSPKETEEWLQQAITDVNQALYNHAKENVTCEGMGTTLVVAICNEDFITVGHVGDSRVYLKTSDGLKQLTNDHSLVGELVRSGQITEVEAMHHPRKNVVLRALGTESTVKPDIRTIDWEAGSWLILCSDGLTDMIEDEEIEKHLKSDEPLSTIADTLIETANERGGEDNVTIAIVRYSYVTEEVNEA
ncbi:Stp1/IreP family PP2C-type Ser/Thr phosphatase [Bacillus shivajii]|uniref:Stp1/IreP family PP2C-type Ser/Thr phosphatase n=1 Tax=Bacillus shivajii TaxID=1983719 RepID=UPI001CFB63CA|nr:Stp1/IreP family PP2C-type Ser/Thr phosphatase [Bacillus shivajii]UCZ51783.1 Stp1/IreP family PP2C-type Ser/Thr phosphatase [Bacillus shivajii]